MFKIRSWISVVVMGMFISWMCILPSELGQAHFEPLPHIIERPTQTKVKRTSQEELCLTQAIYYEAGNQSPEGKEAVALVILNRVNSHMYPKSICGVVHQSSVIHNHRVCQFSYHCAPLYRPNPYLWAEAKRIAKKSLTNRFTRSILVQLGQAQYFHAHYVNPRWANEKEFVGKIGDHVFYRERT